MVTVIGVRFRNAGKLYYFDPKDLAPAPGQAVVVETARGLEYGEVVTGPSEVEDDAITPPLRPVIRIATPEDTAHHAENISREKDAMATCKEKIADHQLQMKLVGCEYTFDNSKILFYFTADKRVDFRLLVKDLASAFHTRIELRQIGVRDEARMMGGLGICGRPLCCSRFLGDFHSVSIKMAKEQNLSLNPTKISGACGRLMCCLQYEEEFYEKVGKELPRVGRAVRTPDGDGIVTEVSILKERVKVRVPKGNDDFEIREYPVAEVQKLSGAKPLPRVDRPQEDQEDDAPDPEIMQALKAAEIDVPDDDAPMPLAEDETEEVEAPKERKPRPPREQRQRQRRGNPKQNRETERPSSPANNEKKPSPAPPTPRQENAAPSAPARPAQEQTAPKRDPWTVPEEFRQKH